MTRLRAWLFTPRGAFVYFCVGYALVAYALMAVALWRWWFK